MWQIAWDLWEHRNGYLHERENNLISLEVNRNISLEFNKGHRQLDRNTRALFLLGLKAILDKPLDIRVQWLRRVQAARDHAAADIQACYQTERKIMSQWLGRSILILNCDIRKLVVLDCWSLPSKKPGDVKAFAAVECYLY
jgi:hypothetical protein